MLFINTSKIQFESNSQQEIVNENTGEGCLSIRQRYNLKAIHNWVLGLTYLIFVVYQYVKDTI